MKRLFALLSLSIVFVVPSIASAIGSPLATCEALGPAPWSAFGKGIDLSELPALDKLVNNVVQDFSSEQFLWFSGEKAAPTLHVGVENPTPADASLLQAATGSDGRVDGAWVDLVDIPIGLEELDARRDEIVNLAEQRKIELATELRPDVGRVRVTVSPKTTAEERAAIQADSTDCRVWIESGDPSIDLMISRADMPPYKAGKRINTPIIVNGTIVDITTCSTAFVFEGDGAGQHPLYGSTAGHCIQGQQQVFDDNSSGSLTPVGRTVLPNLFFGSSPAIGDSVQIDFSLPRSDVTRKVIVNSSTEVTVIGHIAPINIAMGTLVCASGGATATAWCGGMARYDITVTTNYYDWFAGQNRSKQIQNEYCFNGFSGRSGDSGTAIYLSTSPGNVKAVGILSGVTQADTCFTSTVLIGGQTNTHIWTGD